MIDGEFNTNILHKISMDNVNILELRKILIEYKNSGMDKNIMLDNLNKLRSGCDSDKEDAILDLMDFVVGFCNPDLKIF